MINTTIHKTVLAAVLVSTLIALPFYATAGKDHSMEGDHTDMMKDDKKDGMTKDTKKDKAMKDGKKDKMTKDAEKDGMMKDGDEATMMKKDDKMMNDSK